MKRYEVKGDDMDSVLIKGLLPLSSSFINDLVTLYLEVHGIRLVHSSLIKDLVTLYLWDS